MEDSSWVIVAIITSLISSLFLLACKNHLFPSHNQHLPPGPFSIPIIGTLLWMLSSRGFTDLEPTLRKLLAKYDSIITIRIFSRPAIFISSHSLAHQALIQDGAVFADRPPAPPVSKIISSNQHNISSASYGLTWRLLRRNLTSQVLHPSRIRSFSRARSWVLHILLRRLHQNHNTLSHRLKDHLHHAMFCLLVLMCFGNKLNEDQIEEVGRVQRRMLLGFRRFQILNLWPGITRLLLHRRWKEFYQLRHEQHQVLLPLIRARKDKFGEKEEIQVGSSCYVDSLLEVELPAADDGNNQGEASKKRKLNEEEILSLCSEFLDAGTDTTTTAMEWVMANLVKYPDVQEKLFREIESVVAEQEGDKEEVSEEDVVKMRYLRAVSLEGLRRHPPGHFVLPHSVTEDTVLDGKFMIPKNAAVNFMVAEMGWDPRVWEDPMAFKPERFLEGEFDLTGSKEIKMMPFGAGRRMCPGYTLAMLHLDYYVANLVWNFKWEATGEVDLAEKPEFTTVMKHPLEVRLSPRIRAAVAS